MPITPALRMDFALQVSVFLATIHNCQASLIPCLNSDFSLIIFHLKIELLGIPVCNLDKLISPVACTINIYDRRFYDHNDIGLYYNTLETIAIDDPSLSQRRQL